MTPRVFAFGTLAAATSIAGFVAAEASTAPMVLVAPSATTAEPVDAPTTVVPPRAVATGVELGLRLGYAKPIGRLAEHVDMVDIYDRQIPIRLDAGYRFDSHVFAGLYFQYGYPIFSDKSGCTREHVSCSGSDMNMGVGAQYHFSPTGTVDPWVGASAGYELITSAVRVGGIETAQGFEFGNVQLGSDFKFSPAYPLTAIGPFASASLGKFGPQATDQKNYMHMWFMVGFRTVYSL
jgi:hypothetical protein